MLYSRLYERSRVYNDHADCMVTMRHRSDSWSHFEGSRRHFGAISKVLEGIWNYNDQFRINMTSEPVIQHDQ